MSTKRLAKTTLMILALGAMSTTWLASSADAQYRRSNRNNGYRNSGYRNTAYSSNVVRAGTPINVRLDQTISTDDARSGSTWSGTINNDVVSNGQVVIAAGTPVSGVVSSVSQGTHTTKPELDLAIRSVNGRTLYADTEPIVGDSQRARKLGAIAGGAAVGALLGHTVAKDHHGTLIGGLLGGAAGYGATRHALRTMQLKDGTVVTFTTRENVAYRSR